MAKYFGKIGFVDTVETVPGVWREQIIEREYAGDVLMNIRRLQSDKDSTNDDLSIGNRVSIIADPYAYNNFHSIRYIEYMGTRWKVTSIEVQYPRLLLNMGGVYNGDSGPSD